MAVQIVLIAAKIKGRGVRKGGEGEKEHKLAFGFVTSYQIPVPISHVLGESFHNVIVDPVGELLLLVLHAIPTNNTAVLRTALRAWPRGLLLVAACATKGGDGSYYKNVLKFILCVGRHVVNCCSEPKEGFTLQGGDLLHRKRDVLARSRTTGLPISLETDSYLHVDKYDPIFPLFSHTSSDSPVLP
jgi:hypothetical protein